ncbi:hypothetical protein [Pontibacter beigongshangensis]|uniref:hypothetical protein n=1 Tax=Pontibacter beigongshangensis TaxID=2574733 RepID=UPI00164EFFCD|nr:hypothetical protein [Pontibacter beigongshangensis]
MMAVRFAGSFKTLKLSKDQIGGALAQLKLVNGEFLPTLEAYLQEGMKQNKTRLILEIKPSGLGKERSLVLADKVVQLVRK